LNNANSAASPFATSKPSSTASTFATSAFNSTSAASPFALGGASTSAFGALGSGSPFGSAFASKPGKVTSFASPDAPASFGDANSKSKVLGATKSDNEESDAESEAEPNDTFVAEKTDERFHEKTGMDPRIPSPSVPDLNSHSSEAPVETGEENETTKFSAKGKLYYFDDKKWKERGAGTFKVNTQTDSDGNISGRMIMRADGALRVMLNSALFHGMNHGDTKGNRPLTKDIYLASNEDGKVGNLLLRVSLLPISLSAVLMLMNVHSSAMKINPMSSTMF
jgi:lipoprotein-anchoring transpeptidase ErfK/SrfK